MHHHPQMTEVTVLSSYLANGMKERLYLQGETNKRSNQMKGVEGCTVEWASELQEHLQWFIGALSLLGVKGARTHMHARCAIGVNWGAQGSITCGGRRRVTRPGGHNACHLRLVWLPL